MTATLERIKKDIQTLEPEELDDLLRDIRSKYAMPSFDVDEAAQIEAEWDKEIAERVKEVEEGRVELVSGEDFSRHVDHLYTKHGLTRTQAA